MIKTWGKSTIGGFEHEENVSTHVSLRGMRRLTQVDTFYKCV